MSTDSPAISFERSVAISAADIDELGHVNNVVYVRWVQDIATAHWSAAASPQQQQQVAWVLLRHEIDYKHAAMPEDAITASTWVGAADAVRFERFVEILRSNDRKVLARSRTLWCPINRATGRIIRVDNDLRAAFSRDA